MISELLLIRLMQVYQHSANIIREITEKRKGFKTAFYDYFEKNKTSIGS